jgi:hypothetical protein
MRLFPRAAWTVAIVALLALASTDCPSSFARPGYRPPPVPVRPPPGRPPVGGGGRTGIYPGGSMTGTISGGRIGSVPSAVSGMYTGSRIGAFPGTTPGGRIGANIGVPGGLGGFRVRTPAEIQADVHKAIQSRPSTAFDILRRPEARILSETARIALGKKAIEKISLSVEEAKNPAASLAEVLAARKSAAGLPKEVQTGLQRLSAQAERTLLAEGITAVAGPARRGDWGEATARARDWLGRLSSSSLPEPGLQSAEFRARLTELRDSLKGIVEVGKHLAALDRLEGALAAKQPAETVRHLHGMDAGSLGPKLKQQAEGLRGLAELQVQAAGRWTRPPAVADIKRSVARLQSALRDVAGTDPALGRKLLQDLAVKAFLEGHAAEYRELMPADGPSRHAANLLRDLKALALGEGTVSTFPASSAVPVEPGKGAGAPRAPPGLEPLLPEGSRESWRPPVKESALSDLPPLEKAAELAQAVKAQAEASVKPQRKALQAQAEAARQTLNGVHGRVRAPDQVERRQFANLEATLDRRLLPRERVQVRSLLEQKRTPPQIVAVLKSQPGADDEEAEFLLDVTKRRGKPLTTEEKAQALRLRRDGRTAAEVADIL